MIIQWNISLENNKHKYKLKRHYIQRKTYYWKLKRQQEDKLIYLNWEKIWSLKYGLYNIIGVVL